MFTNTTSPSPYGTGTEIPNEHIGGHVMTRRHDALYEVRPTVYVSRVTTDFPL